MLDSASKMEEQQSGSRLKDWHSLFLQSESGLKLLNVLRERRENRVAERETLTKREETDAPIVCEDPISSIYKQMRMEFCRLGAIGRMYLVNLESFTHEICDQKDLPAFTNSSFTMRNQIKHAKLLEFTKRMEQSCLLLGSSSTLISSSTALMHDMELYLQIDAFHHQVGLPVDRLTTHLQFLCAQRRYQIISRTYKLFLPCTMSNAAGDHNRFPYLVTRTCDLEDKLRKLLLNVEASQGDCDPNDDVQLGVYLDRYFDAQILETQIEASGRGLTHSAQNEMGLDEASGLEATYQSIHEFSVELLEKTYKSGNSNVAAEMLTYTVFDDEMNHRVLPVSYHDSLLQNEVDLVRMNDAKYHKERLKRFCSNYSKLATIQDSESTRPSAKGGSNEQNSMHISGENISQTKLYNFYLLKFLHCRQLRQKLMRVLNYLQFLAYSCQFRQRQEEKSQRMGLWEHSEFKANDNGNCSQLEMPWRASSTSEGEKLQASSIRIVGIRSENATQEADGYTKSEIIFSRTLEMLLSIVHQLMSTASKVIKAREIQQMEAMALRSDNPSHECTKRSAIDRLGVLCELIEMEVEYQNAKVSHLLALGVDTIAFQMSLSHCLLMLECIQQRPQIIKALKDVEWDIKHVDASFASMTTLREGYTREISCLSLYSRLIEGITTHIKEEQISHHSGAHREHCDQNMEIATFLVRKLCRNDMTPRLHTSMHRVMQIAQEQWSDILPYPLESFHTLSMHQAILEVALSEWEAIRRQMACSYVTLECKVDDLFTTKKGYNVDISHAIIYESLVGQMELSDVKVENIIKRLPSILCWTQWHRKMSRIMYTCALLQHFDTSTLLEEISKNLQINILESPKNEATFIPLAIFALSSQQHNEEIVQCQRYTPLMSRLIGADIMDMSIPQFLGWIGAQSAPNFQKIQKALLHIMQLEQAWSTFLSHCLYYHNALAGEFVDNVASSFCIEFFDISTSHQNEFRAKATAFIEKVQCEHREKINPFLVPITRYKDKTITEASLIVNPVEDSDRSSKVTAFWHERLERMVSCIMETMAKAQKVPQYLVTVHSCLWLMERIPQEQSFMTGKVDARMSKCAFSYSNYRSNSALAKALCFMHNNSVPISNCAREIERNKSHQVEEESKEFIQNGLLHVPTFVELLESLQLSNYFTITLDSDVATTHQEALVQNFDHMLQIYHSFKLCMELCHLRCCLCFEPAAKGKNVDAKYRSGTNASRIVDECDLYGNLHDAIRELHDTAFRDCSKAISFLAPISDEIIALPVSKDCANLTKRDPSDAVWRSYALQLRDKDRMLASLVELKNIVYLRVQTLLSVLELRLALSRHTEKTSCERLLQILVPLQQKKTRIMITSDSTSDDRHHFEGFIKLLGRWKYVQPQYFCGLDAFLTDVLRNSGVQRSSHLDQKDFLQDITNWLQSLVRTVMLIGGNFHKKTSSRITITHEVQQVIEKNEAGMKGSIIAGLRSLHPDVEAFFYPLRVILKGSNISTNSRYNDESDDVGHVMHVPLHKILLYKQIELLETHETVCCIDNDIMVLQDHYEHFLNIKKDLILDPFHKEPQIIPSDSACGNDSGHQWNSYLDQLEAVCTSNKPPEEIKMYLSLFLEKVRILLMRSNESLLTSIQSQYNQKLNAQTLEIAGLHSHVKELVESIGIRERVYASTKVCQHRFKVIQMETEIRQLRGELEIEQTKTRIATLSQSEREAAMHRVRKMEAQYRAENIPVECDLDDVVLAKRASSAISTRSGHLSVPAKVSLLQSVRSHEEETRTITSLRGEVKQLREIISDLRVHTTVQKERYTQLESRFQHSKELYESQLHVAEAEHKHLRYELQQLQQELISQKQVWAKLEAQLDRFKSEREQQAKLRRDQRMRNIFAAYLKRRKESSRRNAPMIQTEGPKNHIKNSEKSAIHLGGSPKVDSGDTEQLGDLKDSGKENIVSHYQNQIKRLQLQLNKEVELKRKVAAQAADLKTRLAMTEPYSPTLIDKNQRPAEYVVHAQSRHNSEALRDDVPQSSPLGKAYHRPATSEGRSALGESTLVVTRNRSRSAQSHRKYVTLKRPETDLGTVRGNPSAFAIREPLRYR